MKATGKPVGQSACTSCGSTTTGSMKEMHEYARRRRPSWRRCRARRARRPSPMLPTNPPEIHIAKGTPDEDKLAEWAKAGDDAFNKDD